MKWKQFKSSNPVLTAVLVRRKTELRLWGSVIHAIPLQNTV